MHSYQIEIDGQYGWCHDEGYSIGIFHTFDHFQPCLDYKERKIHIFLPHNYSNFTNNNEKKYSVLYTNDGQDIFFPYNGNKSLQLAQVLENVLKENNIKNKQPIIVAIHADNDRDHDYNHEEIVEGIGGGLYKYTDYMCNIVKVWIDKNYPTNPSPEYNCIFGASHGGLASFFIATRRFDCFENCICMSPSLWAGMDSNINNPMLGFENIIEGSIIKDIKQDLYLHNIRPRIYIDWGQCRDNNLENRITEALVEKRGQELVNFLKNELHYKEHINDNINTSELMVVIDHLGGHNENAWNWRLYGALLWFISGKNIQK